MKTPTLRPDCERCAALCCIALAFDRGSMFAFDKPAGEPCRNLDACNRCRIHGRLEARGFGGCVAFDCDGAGQYVSQQMFGGRSWRQDPAVLEPMMIAFSAVRPLHELLVMLRQARALGLPPAACEALDAVEARLMPDGGWTVEDAVAGRIGAAVEEARAFLRSLRPHIVGARTPESGGSPPG